MNQWYECTGCGRRMLMKFGGSVEGLKCGGLRKQNGKIGRCPGKYTLVQEQSK